jgi:fumarate hydratase subunit alpha/L(+)-tartrate dehydratase alpha subunit
MAQFSYKLVEDAAKQLYIRALKILPPDVKDALKKAYDRETNPTAKTIFEAIFKSIELSDNEDMILCQDTGLPIFFVEVGSKFPVDCAKVQAALTEGAKRATIEHPFRGSSLHPVTRDNPQTSIGKGLPVIHWEFNPDSDCLNILMMPKGSGSENMSAMKMFTPAEGIKAVKKFVIDTVVAASSNPCPPGVIGVGIGGTADLVSVLAKKAIARPIGSRNPDPLFAEMEVELEDAINATGSGPMGLGGDISTLAVHIEWAYTHITMNPVAVNTQCWPARRARAKIWADGKVEYGF